MSSVTPIVVEDLAGSIARLPLAFRLALDDIHGRYRRTALGPLWITLGQAATIAGFVIVFSGLFHLDPATYILYLAAGLPVWALISQFLSDMPSAFIGARGFIESFGLPWTIHVWRRAIGYVLVFAHQLVTLFVVMAFMRVPLRPEMLYVIPALLVVFVAGSGFGLLLATLGARYRDVQPTLGMVSGILFMFSPVIWRAEQLRVNEWVVHSNPLYYYITLLRDPLLGHAPPPAFWLGTSLGAVLLWGLGFLAFYTGRRRLYHWL